LWEANNILLLPKLKEGTLMKPESISLYFRDGSSDKVYQAMLEQREQGFVVNFSFGRRFTTLQTGTKTQFPVDYKSAKKIYDKLVSEKMAKGYSPGADGTPYQGTENAARDSGIHCQLLNAIEEAELSAYIEDPAWCFQEKHDGRRMLIQRNSNGITGINRKGLTVALPATIEAAVAGIKEHFIFDGEAVGDKLYIFDLLHYQNQGQDGDIRTWPYHKRFGLLQIIKKFFSSSNVEIVNTATTKAEKEALVNQLRSQAKEGVVIKKLDACYSTGRPASGGSQLKYKFTESVSAIVMKINDKRSVQIGLFNATGELVEAGNVTIMPNFPIPVIDNIVEVRYLYAHAQSGRLYQPVYLGTRDDIDRAACLTAQLKLKATIEDEE
jgi:bifunctional non-homologous end joining protein LigD